MAMPVSSELFVNSNASDEVSFAKHAVAVSHEDCQVAEDECATVKLKTPPKKPCPLEMSIKAANLDLEFEKESFIIMNGTSGLSETGQVGNHVTLPYAAMIHCDQTNVMTPAFLHAPDTPSVPSFASDEPFQLTIQPSLVNEPLRVLLVQVQPQIQESLGSTEVLSGASPITGATDSALFSDVPHTVEATGPIVIDPTHCNDVVGPAAGSSTPEVTASSSVQCSEIPVSVPLAEETKLPPVTANVLPENLNPALTAATPNFVRSAAIPSTKVSKQTVSVQHRKKMTCERGKLPTSKSEEVTHESMICEVDTSGDSSSPEEESEEESLVLKIRKVPPKPRKRKSASIDDEAKVKQERWERVQPTSKKKKRGKDRTERSRERGDWSASDDESLAKIVKRKREDNGHGTNMKAFKRAPKCCPRHCHAKVQPRSQEIAFSAFTKLEDRGLGDRYLASCIQLVTQKQDKDLLTPQDLEAPPSPWPSFGEDDISVEIANESNGNQSLSDEIQNAIKESLKDQETASVQREEPQPVVVMTEKMDVERKEEVTEEEWNYCIVINNRLRMVCLKFLLAVLRIPQSRIALLQKKIVDGETLDRIPVTVRRKSMSIVWMAAKKHLDTLPSQPVPYCLATPPHRFLNEELDRHALFDRFRAYHLSEMGKEVTVKFDTYRKFMLTNTKIVFRRSQHASCPGCDGMNGQPGQASSGQAFRTKGRDRKRKSDIKTEGERHLGAKGKKIKTKATKGGKHNGDVANGSRRRSPKKVQRGDVFSLMLTHLKTVPSLIPKGCRAVEPHKFFSPAAVTIQTLYEDYRKYFLKQTNSELGLRYAIYESLFVRNSHFTIAELNVEQEDCPKCLALPRPTTSEKKSKDSKRKR